MIEGRSSEDPDQHRVAYFGGSFDPPHLGHLGIARAAQQALSLDRVLFAPVGLQPLKPHGPSATFEDRVAMTRLAIAGEPAFQLSMADTPHNTSFSPNYTIDTLMKLRQSLPGGGELFLLLGADSFRTLPRWHRAVEIPFAATLIVASRPNEDLTDLSAGLPLGITLSQAPASPPFSTPDQPPPVSAFHLQNAGGDRASLYVLPNLHYDISATQLRDQIHLSHQASAEATLIPAAVLEYIRRHHLYEQQS
jgi:nicotinate-nucleotide adenylyltransferase